MKFIRVSFYLCFVERNQFNPGQFLVDIQQFYHPDTPDDDYWFKAPIFFNSYDIWNTDNCVLYHLNRKLGSAKVEFIISIGTIFRLCFLHVNTVVKDFCSIFKLEYKTNQCARATAVKVCWCYY